MSDNRTNEISLLVRDLSGPKINGTVTVPLIELDQMRADHANAVMLAKELEANKMYVECKITSYEKVPYFDRYSYQNPAGYKEEKVSEKITYRNLDEVREMIRGEEEKKVFQNLSDLRAEIINLRNKIETGKDQMTKKIEELKAAGVQINTLEEDKKEVEDKFEKLTESNKATLQSYDEIKTELERLQAAYAELKERKSLWSKFLKAIW